MISPQTSDLKGSIPVLRKEEQKVLGFKVILSYFTRLNPAQAVLELPTSYLSLPKARVSGVHPHTQLSFPGLYFVSGSGITHKLVLWELLKWKG